jgi:hypothetical protein
VKGESRQHGREEVTPPVATENKEEKVTKRKKEREGQNKKEEEKTQIPKPKGVSGLD